MVSSAKLYFSDFDVLVHSLADGHAGGGDGHAVGNTWDKLMRLNAAMTISRECQYRTGGRGLSEGAAGTIASTGAYLMQSPRTLPHISLLLTGVKRGASVGRVPAHQEASLNPLHRNPKAMHASPFPRGSCSPTPPAALHFPTSPATSLCLFVSFCWVNDASRSFSVAFLAPPEDFKGRSHGLNPTGSYSTVSKPPPFPSHPCR